MTILQQPNTEEVKYTRDGDNEETRTLVNGTIDFITKHFFEDAPVIISIPSYFTLSICILI